MNPRTQELLDLLDRERNALRAAVDSVPAARHAEAPKPESWSVLAVLEHLAIVEGRIAAITKQRVAEARAAGVGPESETSAVLPTLNLGPVLDRSVKRKASEASEPKTVRDLPSVWRALEESRAALRDVMTSADGLSWREITHPHPVFGPTDLNNWFAFVATHEARHAAQIREIGASFSGAS